METIHQEIWEACFHISHGLMWERDSITHDKILSHTAELKTMADDFYKIAIRHMQDIADKESAADIMVAIIRYIDAAHAIPPLRGNTAWFGHTLAALTELVSPNAGLSRSDSRILDYIEKGIKSYRESVFDDEDGLE